MSSENAKAVRRKLKLDYDVFSTDRLQGPIEDVVAYLHDLEKTLHRKYRGRYGWFEIEFSEDVEQVYGCRWETQKEQQARMAVEEVKEREKQIEQERRRQSYFESHPHICPCCQTRYRESKFVSNGECPQCMTIPPPQFVNYTQPIQ